MPKQGRECVVTWSVWNGAMIHISFIVAVVLLSFNISELLPQNKIKEQNCKNQIVTQISLIVYESL